MGKGCGTEGLGMVGTGRWAGTGVEIDLDWPPEAPEKGQSMQYRELGHTREKVSCIGVGGSHLSGEKVSPDEAIGIVRAALDAGINFLDNSWDYGEGESERRVGKALKD